MTYDEAVDRIGILKERNDLNRDEMCKGFQIALALFDDSLIDFFRESYHRNFSALMLDLALHINESEKVELFKTHENEWRKICCRDAEIILIAIMNKSQKFSFEAETLVYVLNHTRIFRPYFNSREQFEDLSRKSIDELIACYLADFNDRVSCGSINGLYNRALQSLDMIFLQEAQDKAKAKEDKDIEDCLLGHIALSRSGEDIDEALKIASSIEGKESKELALYNIAKHIYSQDSLRVSAIVSDLSIKFQYGFIAFLASSNKDLKEVIGIINEIEKQRKTRVISNDDYSNYLMQVAYSVVKNHPKIALDILGKLDTLRGESAPILLSKPLEQDVDAIFQYDILSALHKKIAIPFQQLWGVTSKILPYAY